MGEKEEKNLYVKEWERNEARNVTWKWTNWGRNKDRGQEKSREGRYVREREQTKLHKNGNIREKRRQGKHKAGRRDETRRETRREDKYTTRREDEKTRIREDEDETKLREDKRRGETKRDEEGRDVSVRSKRYCLSCALPVVVFIAFLLIDFPGLLPVGRRRLRRQFGRATIVLSNRFREQPGRRRKARISHARRLADLRGKKIVGRLLLQWFSAFIFLFVCLALYFLRTAGPTECNIQC